MKFWLPKALKPSRGSSSPKTVQPSVPAGQPPTAKVPPPGAVAPPPVFKPSRTQASPGGSGVGAGGPVSAPGSPKPAPVRRRKRKIDVLKAKIGTFLFQIVTLALLLSALGIWGYTQVMKLVLGRFDLFDWQSAAMTLYGAPNVLIIDPARTEDFLRPDTTVYDTIWPYYHRYDPWPLADTLWYAGEMKRPKAAGFETWQLLGTPGTKRTVRLADYWKELFFQNKISFRMMQESALTALPEDVNMLVLPGCLLLSQEEKLGIKRFVAKGGRLLMCWSLGVRDENGAWVGYDFLQQLVGGLLAGVATDVSGGTSFILKGSGPITAMLPPGEHLEFFTYNGFVGLNIIEPRMQSDAWWFIPYWHNGGKNSIPTPTVVAHGSYVAGKIVWFSFTPDPVQPHKDNNLILQKMILNSINWLSGKPLLNIRIWPAGYSAAAATIIEGKSAPETLLRLNKVMKDAGREYDLMLNPEEIPDVFSLSNDEFNDLIMAGSDTSMLNDDNDNQADWMAKGIARLERVVGRKPNGVAAPGWGYGDDLGLAAARNELRYFLGNSQPRFYGPKDMVIRVSGLWIFARYRNLAVLPKCQVSADEWATYAGLKGEAQLYDAMDHGLRRVRRSGGLYLAILNPSVIEEENAYGLGPRLSARMDSLGIWQAPLHTLIERFAGWEGLRAKLFEVTATRLRLEISNESDVTLRDVTFEIYFAPDIVSRVEVTSEVLGFRPGNVNWNRRSGLCTFITPEIASGINAAMFIDVRTSEEPAQPDSLK